MITISLSSRRSPIWPGPGWKNEPNPRGVGWPLEALALCSAWWPDDTRIRATASAIRHQAPNPPTREPFPRVLLNTNAHKFAADHAYMGVSQWMHSRITIAEHRWLSLGSSPTSTVAQHRYDVSAHTLDYGRMVSEKGIGTWPDNFDADEDGYSTVYHHTNNFGSANTTASVRHAYLLCRERRDDAMRYLAHWYENTDAMRVTDKNANLALILLMGPHFGWR